jgi:hypothetical protein
MEEHRLSAAELKAFILAVQAARHAQQTYFRHQTTVNLRKATNAEATVDAFLRMCEQKGIIPAIPREPPATQIHLY